MNHQPVNDLSPYRTFTKCHLILIWLSVLKLTYHKVTLIFSIHVCQCITFQLSATGKDKIQGSVVKWLEHRI